METTRKALSQHIDLEQLLMRARTERVLVSGVIAAARALVVAAAAERAPGPLLVLAADVLAAADLADDLATLGHPGRLLRLPIALDGEPTRADVRVNYSERLRTLAEAATLRAGDILVVPSPALLDPLPHIAAEGESSWIRTGDRLDRDALIRSLHEAGLTREPMVTAPGEFSVRGDIVDVFPFGAQQPTRLELWDECVESIREFQPESQRSCADLQTFLPPVRADLIQETAAPETLLAMLPGEHLLLVIEPHRAVNALEESSFVRALDEPRRRARRLLEETPALLIDAVRDDRVPCSYLSVEPAPAVRALDEVGTLLERLARRAEHVIVFCASELDARRLEALASEHAGSMARRIETRVASLSEGFVIPDLGVALVNHHEILSRRRQRRPHGDGALATRMIEAAFELTTGDYVVHAIHGIARYRGELTMTRDGVEEDFLTLEFDGGTLLYVPSTKIELVQRYIGAGGAPPKLDRIGGRSFARKKAQVAQALEDIAAELLEIQAARMTQTGHAFPDSDPLQLEFEQSFPFEDTPDQARSMEELRRDLAAPRPMDRLLCGDVGFGKTELAVRAAFMVVLAGKQAAVLVPTTLLAHQHLETFRSRLASYPVRVEVLSRLVPPRRQKPILEATQSGQVDILIGTHRLLSRDVRFRELGLLVVDEEQRFGVKHKEQLKKLRRTVDILTLSATPIPRTLHMALTGLRDISSLRTPPAGRRSIQTEVHYRSEDLIVKATQRELARGGQVYFVRNRIARLEQVAGRLRKRLPHAVIAVAHGQMRPRELEKTADAFARGEIDVLVCTTIIESGIDIPSVNTLIVDRADRFGLADLHQLRGRVGRSDVQAYAYFMVPRGPIGTVASKRLRAIESLSHLGAGFDLSLRDLEIRGAGNLLGKEQHGHIAAVGYDLYCRLLERAVARMRGESRPTESEPEEIDIDIPVSASLPASYIADPTQRMELLRRFGRARGHHALEALAQELRDRFGRLPTPACRFIDLLAVRNASRHLGIRRIFYSGGETVLLQLFDAGRFQKRGPFRRQEIRPTAGDVAHLVLPSDARRPAHVLAYLRRRFEGGRTGSRLFSCEGGST
ncbi:MAG: transcription-repair coupling factor [Planctomycetota bacterium]